MTAQQSETKPFELLADALCLDFANTCRRRLLPPPTELLTSYTDLMRFSTQSGLLTLDQAAQLHMAAAQRPAEAAAVLQQAITLRESIYAVFLALAHDRTPEVRDLDTINRALAHALAQRRVITQQDSFLWGWVEHPLAPDRVLWPVSLSAAELLIKPPGAVRKCASDSCGVLFVDISRSQRRRWCTMQRCGNRAKVERFRARRRAD